MKPRSDGLFAKLKPAQREELLTLLTSGGDYEEAKKLCSGWGVPTSLSALSRFYSTHSFAWRLDRAKAAAQATAGTSPESIQAEQARLLAQKIFEAVASPDCPPKVLIALRGLEVKADALRLAERRVAVLERQMADAKAKLEGLKSKGGLSPKTLKEIEEAANLL
jgi:hypothetical protein